MKKNIKKLSKVLLLDIVLMILIIRCDYRNEHEYYKSPEKAKTILFKEASSMKGLSAFIIGKTTIENMLKINQETKKDSRYGSYDSYGYWNGAEFSKEVKEDVPSFNIYHCPDVESYKISEYYIGDIKIQYLELYFYKNILYEIDCWTSDDLRDAFTKKYGEGVKIKSLDITGPKDNVQLKAVEDILWENDSIISTYLNSIESLGSKISSHNDIFKISTKTKILDQIMKCKELESQKQNQKKTKEREESINKI